MTSNPSSPSMCWSLDHRYLMLKVYKLSIQIRRVTLAPSWQIMYRGMHHTVSSRIPQFSVLCFLLSEFSCPAGSSCSGSKQIEIWNTPLPSCTALRLFFPNDRQHTRDYLQASSQIPLSIPEHSLDILFYHNPPVCTIP